MTAIYRLSCSKQYEDKNNLLYAPNVISYSKIAIFYDKVVSVAIVNNLIYPTQMITSIILVHFVLIIIGYI